jgi:hypothetical protein
MLAAGAALVQSAASAADSGAGDDQWPVMADQISPEMTSIRH